MNGRLERLEMLLGRVQRNAQAPRLGGTAPGAKGSASAEAVLLDSFPPPSALTEDSTQISAAALSKVPAPSLDLDEPGAADGSSPPLALEMDAVDAPLESGTEPVPFELPEASEPPWTPPPESGAEPASAPFIPKEKGPTMGQLGQTIALEEASGQDLELASTRSVPSAPPQSLSEAKIPGHFTGSYSDDMVAPPEAQEELARLRLGAPGDLAAEVVVRPIVSTSVVDFVSAPPAAPSPKSFAELVELSLSL